MGRLTARVLGSAAGGGFPQWNCRCPTCRLAWAGDARVQPRTQASLAVTADGESWLLINASPDLPQQIRQSRALQRAALSSAAPVPCAAARRQMHEGPGASLGAQSLLLPGDDPAERREPDRAL